MLKIVKKNITTKSNQKIYKNCIKKIKKVIKLAWNFNKIQNYLYKKHYKNGLPELFLIKTFGVIQRLTKLSKYSSRVFKIFFRFSNFWVYFSLKVKFKVKNWDSIKLLKQYYKATLNVFLLNKKILIITKKNFL